MNTANQSETNSYLSQLIYALLVIVLIPIALAFNTFYLLRNVQRDTDYELNNKALLVSNVFSLQVRDLATDSAKLQTHLNDLVKLSPEIKAIEVFTFKDNDITPLTSTSPRTRAVTDPVLNQLAWARNEAVSKQIVAAVGNGDAQRIWLVGSPFHDVSNKKIGLINIYISAAEIDAISNRTINDSLVILVITMVIIILLLLNHFRFYEMSVLFKKLREVDKLKDDFISIASHELKTPLTAIKGYVSLLLKNPVVNSSPDLSRNIAVITQSADRLKAMVDDILDISRIEQGRMKFSPQVCSLPEITMRAVNELFPQAQAKGLKLIYIPLNANLQVTIDPDRMLQVLINLIGNAIKYTPTGEVIVYHDINSKDIKTYIKDTGVGISHENRDKLFQKFSRIYNDQTATVTGTGLGLWITKEIIEKMHGKISVESIQGQGSVFIISLPITPTLNT